MAINVNTVNLRDAKDLCIKALRANLPILLLSQPGAGKSSLARQLAEKFNLEFIDIRLATHDPTDLTGLPRFVDNKAQFVPFDLFPLENTPLPKGKKGWLCLCDEVTSCSRSMQAASYRLILDREVGQHKLHPNCFLMAAGNRSEDNAVVNDLSTALKSRLITLRVTIDPEQWIEDFAVPYDIDHRIIGYIKANPDALNDFDPDSDTDTFCCPRTLEFLSRIIKGHDITKKDIPLIAGTIGDVRAGEFYAACQVLQSCTVTIDDILKDPFLCDMPQDKDGERNTVLDWLFVTSLAQYVTKERIEDQLDKELNNKDEESSEFQNIIHYINRFEEPLRIIFVRLVVQKNRLVLSSKFFMNNCIDILNSVKNLLGD